MPSDENGAGDQRNHSGNPDYDHHRTGELVDLMPEYVSGEAEERRPRQRADDIGEHELPPRHAVGSGEDAGEAAQQRNEAGDENDLAAIAQEQIFAELDPAFGNSDIRTIPQQQPIAVFAADDVADHLPDDRRAGRGEN